LASHGQGGLLLLSIAIAACTGPERQDPEILVVGHMRINGLEGGFTGELTDDAIFGRGLARSCTFLNRRLGCRGFSRKSR